MELPTEDFDHDTLSTVPCFDPQSSSSGAVAPLTIFPSSSESMAMRLLASCIKEDAAAASSGTVSSSSGLQSWLDDIL